MIQMGANEGNQLTHTALPSDTLVVMIKIQTTKARLRGSLLYLTFLINFGIPWAAHSVLPQSRNQRTSTLLSSECTYKLYVYRANSADEADLSASPSGTVFGTSVRYVLSTSGFSIKFRAHFAFKYSNSRTLPNLEGKVLVGPPTHVWPVSVGLHRSAAHCCLHRSFLFIGFLEMYPLARSNQHWNKPVKVELQISITD